MGDSSCSGFGSCWWVEDGAVIDAQFGRWSFDVTENESSNFQKSANLVNSLKSYLKSGKIDPGTKVFICTDNAGAEFIYFIGLSKSCKLHKMIVELQQLEMEGQLIVHFLWILSKRMISQGTDGLSKGDLSSDGIQGVDFLKFLPFNETALEQQKNLKDLIKLW